MEVSHSRIECFDNCPYKYKLKYLDKIKTLKDTDAANNPLYLGTALHTGIEKDAETAIKEYYAQYPIITDEHINEAIKLRYLIPKAKELLPPGDYEVPIKTEDFIGYIDLLSPNDDGTYDLWDFKYSNNSYHYKDSPQLHLYKYFKEKESLNQIKIKNLHYLLVPKINIKLKKTETLDEFRDRLQEELFKSNIKILDVEYNPDYVINFTLNIKKSIECEEFNKNETYLCDWCEYQKYCKEGIDYMLLPVNERRNIEKISKRTVWIYGKPFSGKTTFANKFPDPLMLNTDGNIKFVDAPYIPIKDEVKVEGRMTKRTFAWQYMYDQMGITHESDDSFRAWDKVRTEFLSTLKRLMNLDYENIILISHEDASKDLTKRGGDKITSIKPNIQEKAANKIAGMVDIVARIVAEDNKRILSFKSDEVVFGGGRLTTNASEIDLNYDEFIEVYDEANKNISNSTTSEVKTTSRRKSSRTEENVEEQPKEEVIDENTKEQMTTADDNESVVEEQKVEETEKVEEQPKNESSETPRRVRKRRTE